MSKKILVLTGSARPNSASEALLPYFEKAVAAHDDVELDIAKAGELSLPFYNAPTPPSAEGFAPTDEHVQAWTKRVAGADGVIWLMPEYNHSLTGIQKNAIDWLYREWQNKPVSIVAYGFYEGKHVLDAVQNVIDVVNPAVKYKVGLATMKHINPDGTAIEAEEVTSRIQAAVDSVLA